MAFVEEEGTRSSFQGIEAVIREHGLLVLYIPIGGAITG